MTKSFNCLHSFKYSFTLQRNVIFCTISETDFYLFQLCARGPAHREAVCGRPYRPRLKPPLILENGLKVFSERAMVLFHDKWF